MQSKKYSSGTGSSTDGFTIGDNVYYKGQRRLIISFVPSTGKYVLAGIGNPVPPADLLKKKPR